MSIPPTPPEDGFATEWQVPPAGHDTRRNHCPADPADPDATNHHGREIPVTNDRDNRGENDA